MGHRLVSTKTRLAGLDGLRGFALALMVWFHFRAGDMPGGWIGICVFFPLSGFLITRLLLEELDRTSTVSLRAFWVRRARRLLPALFALLALGAPAAVLGGVSPNEVGGAVWSTLLYANNWWQLTQDTNYWAQLTGDVAPFEHLWSLSVEEQFYFVWPLVVLAVWTISQRPRRALLGVCIAVMVVGVVLGFSGTPDVTFVYYNTLVRSAEILAGASLAIVVSARPHWFTRPSMARTADIAGWLAVGFVLLVGMTLSGIRTGFIENGGMFVAAIAGCVAIVGCLAGGSLTRVMEWSVLRWLGTRSYGIYLWHWPIFVLVTEESVGFDGWWLTGIHVGLTTACSVLSYWLVEEPWRTRRARRATPAAAGTRSAPGPVSPSVLPT